MFDTSNPACTIWAKKFSGLRSSTIRPMGIVG
jgi:hypothetical protein